MKKLNWIVIILLNVCALLIVPMRVVRGYGAFQIQWRMVSDVGIISSGDAVVLPIVLIELSLIWLLVFCFKDLAKKN